MQGPRTRIPVTSTPQDYLDMFMDDTESWAMLVMKSHIVGHRENEKLLMEETIESSGSLALQREGKAFSTEIRMFNDPINNHAPTKKSQFCCKNLPIDQD